MPKHIADVLIRKQFDLCWEQDVRMEKPRLINRGHILPDRQTEWAMMPKLICYLLEQHIQTTVALL